MVQERARTMSHGARENWESCGSWCKRWLGKHWAIVQVMTGRAKGIVQEMAGRIMGHRATFD